MKVVLRNSKTGTYFVGNGGWTEDLREAQDFPSSAVATYTGLQTGQEGIEVLLLFEDPKFNISMPLHRNERTVPIGAEVVSSLPSSTGAK